MATVDALALEARLQNIETQLVQVNASMADIRGNTGQALQVVNEESTKFFDKMNSKLAGL